MAQKIVMRVSMPDEETRKEAMQIAVGVGGTIKSMTIEGDDGQQLVVVGSDVDAVKLTRRLRKRMGFCCSLRLGGLLWTKRGGSVQLLSVGPVEKKKEEPKKEEKQESKPPLCHCSGVPAYPVYCEIPAADSNLCRIL